MNKNVFLEQDETYKSVSQEILKIEKTKNYSKYIHYEYLDKFPSFLEDHNEECDFKEDNNRKMFFCPPCVNYVIDNNYCSKHNKNMI